MEQQSLYERLGGVNAIAMVVDRFSDAIVETEAPGKPVPEVMERVGPAASLNFTRTLWLCQATGGPF